MNARDLAQQKAWELLQEMGVDPEHATHRALSIATTAFLRGWSHGLQDAQRIQKEHLNRAYGTIACGLLKRQAG